MKEKDFIQLIQYFSHDLMNELQVIQGYLSMDQTEKVKAKVNELIDYYNLERKLINIHAPKFILWLLQARNAHKNIALSYQINVKNRNLSRVDQTLVKHGEHIINFITVYGDKNELYDVNIELCEHSGTLIKLIVSVKGRIFNQEYIEDLANEEENRIQIDKTEDGITCEFSCFVNE